MKNVEVASSSSGNVADYYNSVRKDVLRVIPPGVTRMLELGTGTGATAAFIKEQWQIPHVVGVELFPAAAAAARDKLDDVVEGNLEEMDLSGIPGAPFDLILALDVLEHLNDPWSLMRQLKTLLQPGGILIASIPNVNHFSCALPLFFKGSWDLEENGILDRTHLRFFVKKTAIDLVAQSGLKVTDVQPSNLVPQSKAGKLNLATFGLFERFLAIQYLITAERY